MEKMPASYFHGEAAEQNQCGVDPQNGRQPDGVPVAHPGIRVVEMTAALTGKKRADQGNEKHQVAGQGKKQHHAVAAQQITRPTPAGWAVLPVLTIATAACRPAGYRRFAAKSGIFALCLNRGAGEGCRHGSKLPTFEDYSCLPCGSQCILQSTWLPQ